MKYCTFSVLPGTRIKSQMISSEVKKTKKIANLRIHVERFTNRIKSLFCLLLCYTAVMALSVFVLDCVI